MILRMDSWSSAIDLQEVVALRRQEGQPLGHLLVLLEGEDVDRPQPLDRGGELGDLGLEGREGLRRGVGRGLQALGLGAELLAALRRRGARGPRPSASR